MAMSPETAVLYREWLAARPYVEGGETTQSQREVREVSDRKQRARRSLQDAVRHGKIIKPSACSRCARHVHSRDMHGHHADYTKPLSVEWLCQPCHQLEDGSGWKP